MCTTPGKRNIPDDAIPHMQPSFSQEGEDRILQRLFEIVPPQSRFYVDVGAHHPFRFSNTYLFYSLGWRGINVDGTPGSMAAFDRLRPRDINVERVVTDRPEPVFLDLYNEPALNSVHAERAAQLPKDVFHVVERVRLHPRRLDDILTDHLPPNTTLDFLSVDVEGEDLAVLRSNDWARFRPSFVVVEDQEFRYDSATDSPIAAFLKSRNYRMRSKLGWSCIWTTLDF